MQKVSAQQELETILSEIAERMIAKEWMTLKEGAKYAGISYNTLIKFRQKGLKVAEIDGVKRISKTEIDNFFKEYSF